MREFVPTYEAAEADPYPPIECVVCEYTFHKHAVEDPATGHVAQVETLDRAMRDKAKEKLVDEFVDNVVANGYALRPAHRKILIERNN